MIAAGDTHPQSLPDREGSPLAHIRTSIPLLGTAARMSGEYIASTRVGGRLNRPVPFNLPPTRVEAMYSPDIRAAVPNKGIEVRM